MVVVEASRTGWPLAGNVHDSIKRTILSSIDSVTFFIQPLDEDKEPTRKWIGFLFFDMDEFIVTSSPSVIYWN